MVEPFGTSASGLLENPHMLRLTERRPSQRGGQIFSDQIVLYAHPETRAEWYTNGIQCSGSSRAPTQAAQPNTNISHKAHDTCSNWDETKQWTLFSYNTIQLHKHTDSSSSSRLSSRWIPCSVRQNLMVSNWNLKQNFRKRLFVWEFLKCSSYF